jgi:hypothetical protein
MIDETHILYRRCGGIIEIKAETYNEIKAKEGMT